MNFFLLSVSSRPKIYHIESFMKKISLALFLLFRLKILKFCGKIIRCFLPDLLKASKYFVLLSNSGLEE